MTQITVRGDLVAGIAAACVISGVPRPTAANATTGTLTQATSVIEWVPDLSPTDLATVNAIVKLAVGSTLVTKAERDSIEPDIANGRQFLQATKAQYLALTQVQRDGIEFDNLTSIWRILRVFLRD